MKDGRFEVDDCIDFLLALFWLILGLAIIGFFIGLAIYGVYWNNTFNKYTLAHGYNPDNVNVIYVDSKSNKIIPIINNGDKE